MGYKFNGKRYITRGTINTLPLDIQLILFQSIELMRGKVEKLDWLQVMMLETIDKDGVKVLHITHEQEQPEGKVEYYIPVDCNIQCKVFVIDDVEYVTMLLAEEY